MASETINIDVNSALAFRALQPATTGDDWTLVMNIFDDGSAYDLDGEAAAMSIRDPWGSEVLSGTGTLSDDDDAVTSIVTFTFRAASMATLAPGSYTVAVRLTESPATKQVLLARLPVRDGGFA